MKTRLLLLSSFLLLTSSFFIPFTGYGARENTPCGYTIIKTLYFPGMVVNAGNPAGMPFTVSIPLKRIGRLFMIEATIDGETGNFMFDTGSQELVLNSIYFRKYMTKDELQSGGVTGLADKVTRTVVRSLDVSGILRNNTPADVTDLGHLENRRGVKIFGLFGFTVFRDMEVVIDVNRNQLLLFRLDRNGKRLSYKDAEFRSDLTQKGELYKNIIFLRASVGGKPLTFCFDTGAESNVLSSWLPKKVMEQVTITRRSNLSGVGTARADVLYGKLNDFIIGDRQLAGMQVIITSLESMSASFDHPLDGMLGYDFLEKGIVSVNLVTKDVKVSFERGGKP